MKKIIISVLIISLLVLPNGINAKKQINTTKNQVLNETKEELLISFLVPYITKAVLDHYDGTKQFWRTKIINVDNLRPGSYQAFRFSVKIETFVGPHNPPYSTDKLTFEKKGKKIELISYEEGIQRK